VSNPGNSPPQRNQSHHQRAADGVGFSWFEARDRPPSASVPPGNVLNTTRSVRHTAGGGRRSGSARCQPLRGQRNPCLHASNRAFPAADDDPTAMKKVRR